MKPNNETSNNSDCFRKNPLLLYNGLRNEESQAILYLHHKIKKHVGIKQYQIKAIKQDVEELTNDAVLMTLQKIKNDSYTFQGFSPLSFALVIADNLMRNFARKKRIKHFSLEQQEVHFEAEVETYLHQKELERQIKTALDQLDTNSQLIIRLKYYEGLKDEEVVRRKLAPYSSVNSLKSRRCASMRKLSTVLKPIFQSNLVFSS